MLTNAMKIGNASVSAPAAQTKAEHPKRQNLGVRYVKALSSK
jgi:hypothetical protein